VKVAGVLTVLLGVLLVASAWIGLKQTFKARLNDALEYDTDQLKYESGQSRQRPSMHDLDKDDADERFDEIIGILGGFTLIGGVVLISQGKRTRGVEGSK
jgi:hypothetical protein